MITYYTMKSISGHQIVYHYLATTLGLEDRMSITPNCIATNNPYVKPTVDEWYHFGQSKDCSNVLHLRDGWSCGDYEERDEFECE